MLQQFLALSNTLVCLIRTAYAFPISESLKACSSTALEKKTFGVIVVSSATPHLTIPFLPAPWKWERVFRVVRLVCSSPSLSSLSSPSLSSMSSSSCAHGYVVNPFDIEDHQVHWLCPQMKVNHWPRHLKLLIEIGTITCVSWPELHWSRFCNVLERNLKFCLSNAQLRFKCIFSDSAAWSLFHHWRK